MMKEMAKVLEEKLTAPLTVTACYKAVDGWFAAWVEEIPGVNSQGRTLDEARTMLADALAMMVAEYRADTQAEFGTGEVRETLTLG
jgi:predicted RNase H-like HicB family nuclease